MWIPIGDTKMLQGLRWLAAQLLRRSPKLNAGFHPKILSAARQYKNGTLDIVVMQDLFADLNIVKRFRQTSDAMTPALTKEQILFTRSATLVMPEVGDIIVHRNPENKDERLTRRVVATEGDVLSRMVTATAEDGTREKEELLTLGKNELWVNKENAAASGPDSMDFGFVSKSMVDGVVVRAGTVTAPELVENSEATTTTEAKCLWMDYASVKQMIEFTSDWADFEDEKSDGKGGKTPADDNPSTAEGTTSEQKAGTIASDDGSMSDRGKPKDGKST